VYGQETTAAMLASAAAAVPDRIAVASADRELSYRDLLHTSSCLGQLFLSRGLARGDRVAVWMSDTIEHVQCYVGCALAGLVVVPINIRFTEHEARHVIADSGARLLVYTPDVADRVDRLEPGPVELMVLEAGPDLDIAVAAAPRVALPLVQPDDVLVIGYTSGTTGKPKGAVLTQRSVATLARMNALAYHLPIGSVAAMTGSMSFVAVVPAHIMSHFYVRGTVRLLGAWTISSLIDAIETHQATFTYLPSPLIDEFCDLAARDPGRWASLVTVLHSASKVAPDKLERLAGIVGGRLVEGWGMTENSGGLMTATTPGDAVPGAGRLATVGRAVPEVEINLVDPAGARLPHDGTTVGELTYRSPALMAGYWGQPEASAAAMVDGWYRTGDLGTIDPDGYVTLVERRTDLIVSGGMNVYPSEVEQCLMTHPGVAACCVVGLPHERWGQSVVAVVVRRGPGEVSATQLIDHCRTFLAGYKKPTQVHFVEELPTTASLKTPRHAVRAMLS
jgi:fatty-acyl-CoA synthase